MPIPDPHAEEPTVEVDPDYYKNWREAQQAEALWHDEVLRLRAILEKQIGDAYAGTINGDKVITYRPERRYATRSIQRDHPDLTQHFMKRVVVEEFQTDDFIHAHPEIAEKYRIRSFRGVD